MGLGAAGAGGVGSWDSFSGTGAEGSLAMQTQPFKQGSCLEQLLEEEVTVRLSMVSASSFPLLVP